MNFLRTLNLLLLLCVGLIFQPALGVFREDEPNFYGGGLPTAETLRHGEWIVSGPISTWLAYGATSRLTLVVDYIQAIAGTPAALVRYQIGEGPDHALYALESYGVFFTKRYDDKRRDDYQVSHLGGQAWLHLARTAFLSERWHWHSYVGATYTNEQRYAPYKGPVFPSAVYEDHVNPDLGTGFEYRGGPRWRLHLYALYGNTFEFEDYTTLKSQVAGRFPMVAVSRPLSGFLPPHASRIWFWISSRPSGALPQSSALLDHSRHLVAVGRGLNLRRPITH